MKTINSLAGLAPGPVRLCGAAGEPHGRPHHAAPAPGSVAGLDGSPGCRWGGGEWLILSRHPHDMWGEGLKHLDR